MSQVTFINDYIDEMKNIQKELLDFLEDEDNQTNIFEDLIQLFEDQNIFQEKQKTNAILHLISSISENHQRCLHFIDKIEQILYYYQQTIKNFFTNFEIFNIFKDNKRILLFLFNKKFIFADKTIFKFINHNFYKKRFYLDYFLPEFELFLTTSNIPNKEYDEYFEYKRKEGENDDYICQLIRNDSIVEFISFVNKKNYPLSSLINESIFETNSFLLKKKSTTTLIKYAAFYGSIQILKYLYMNDVDLKSSLWLYAIHSKNPDVIHFLEENHVPPPKNTHNYCYRETIKCHHIDFMDYIKDYLTPNKIKKDINLFPQSLHFYNYIDFHNNNFTINEYYENFFFNDFCKYDYLTIVDFLVNKSQIKINGESGISSSLLKNGNNFINKNKLQYITVIYHYIRYFFFILQNTLYIKILRYNYSTLRIVKENVYYLRKSIPLKKL